MYLWIGYGLALFYDIIFIKLNAVPSQSSNDAQRIHKEHLYHSRINTIISDSDYDVA